MSLNNFQKPNFNGYKILLNVKLVLHPKYYFWLFFKEKFMFKNL